MSGWLGGVVTEAWKRGIAAQKLPRLIQRAVGSGRLRCGLVEEVQDALVALQTDLERGFGFEVYGIQSDDVLHAAATHGRSRRKSAMLINSVDFLAATNFHASVVHAAAATLGKPLVVLTIHPDLERAIRGQLERGSLTVIACDPRFADRLRVGYDPDERADIHLILADDEVALRKLDPEEPVLITRSARRLAPSLGNPTVHSYTNILSADSATALAGILVRKNLMDGQ
jgi:hypothetical protein